MPRAVVAITLVCASFACNQLFGQVDGTLADACAGSLGDPLNCGTCGHDCLGGACANGVCQPVTLASQLDYPTGMVIDDASVTWVNFNAWTIDRIAKDGTCASATCPEQIAPTTTFKNVHSPLSIATDGTNLFFANFDSALGVESVVQRNPNGTFTILGTTGGPYSVAYADGFVYWTNAMDTVVVTRAQVGAANSAQSIALGSVTDGGATGARGIVVDAERVYWVTYDTGVIYSAPIDGTCDESSTCTVLYNDIPKGPTAIAADDAYLYWSNGTANGNTVSGDHTIKKMPKAGGVATIVASNQQQVQTLALYSDFIYWGDFGDSSIRSARTTDPQCDGAACTLLATEQVFPAAIAVDDRAVYWTSQRVSGTTLVDSGAVRRLAK